MTLGFYEAWPVMASLCRRKRKFHAFLMCDFGVPSARVQVMKTLLFSAVMVFAACSGSVDDTDSPPDTGDTDTDSQTGDTSGTDVDVDGDGFTADEDCNDYDPRQYPGAEEVFDDLDNDCDGLVDAEGSYAGSFELEVDAAYEGVPYHWNLDCPVTLLRAGMSLSFTVTCTATHSNASQLAVMKLMLGDELTIQPSSDNAAVTGDEWNEGALFSSSDGWTAPGEGWLSWSDTSHATLYASFSGPFVSLGGSGSLTR